MAWGDLNKFEISISDLQFKNIQSNTDSDKGIQNLMNITNKEEMEIVVNIKWFET